MTRLAEAVLRLAGDLSGGDGKIPELVFVCRADGCAGGDAVHGRVLDEREEGVVGWLAGDFLSCRGIRGCFLGEREGGC